MRVLQVIPAVARRYGGPSETIVSLTRGLLDLGVEVVVASTDADGDGRLAVPYEEITRWRGMPIHFFPRLLSEAYKYSPALAQWLNRSICDFDLVHIHAFFSHSSVSAADACRKLDVPYVLRPLGSLDPETYARHPIRKRLFYHVLGEQLLRNASAIQYATEREMFHVEGKFSPGRGFVAHPGIGGFDDTDGAIAQASDDVHADIPRPYVLYLGRIHPIKQLEMLVDAFLAATSSPPLRRWNLVIAGDGEAGYVMKLRDYTRRKDGEKRVHFTGWMKGRAKRSILNAAELFVLASKHENFGTSVAEAMLAGVPVVVSDDVFLSDRIRRHNAGWVVDNGARAVTAGLREALSSSKDRGARAKNAKQLANRQFSIEHTSRIVLEKYNDIVIDHRRARGH